MKIKATKAEADKRKLHPKNLSMAPSMNVYNNYSSKSLSPCSWRKKLECLLQENEVQGTQTCQITQHVASYQGHHRLGCAWCEQIGSLLTTELWFARKCQQILKKSLLLYNNKWLDFRKRTITSLAEQKIRTKCHCTFIYHPVTLPMTMGKNMRWLKTLGYENVCVTHVGCISKL